MCDPTFGIRRRAARHAVRLMARFGIGAAVFCALMLAPALHGPSVMAQPIQCPQIPLQVTPLAGAMLLEWDQPDPAVISSLSLIDTSWGGTARVEIRGDFDGHCDMDIRLRSVKKISEFVRPFVAEPIYDAFNPNSPNYWGGTALPSASGIPDICENHSIIVQARDTDTLLTDGTASGNPVELVWFEETETGTITLPSNFRPGVDQIPLRYGVMLTFSEGTLDSINVQTGERHQFTVSAITRRVSMAWDYVAHGGEEGDRVSSSDDGESELIFCNPGDWVDFKFGLEVRVVADTVLAVTSVHDTTDVEYDTTIVGEEITIDTIYTIETTQDTVRTINGLVPAISDSLGEIAILYRKIDGYRLYRANITDPSNFSVLREFKFCDSLDLPELLNDPVQYTDMEGVHNDFPYNYFVAAFDTLTGKGELDTLLSGVVEPRSDGTEDMKRIAVVPNPYKRRAAWEADGPERIQFTHLPSRATIRVYTVGSDLVREWIHSDAEGGGSSSWDMRNGDGELVASGVYIFYVKSLASTGGERVGKFIIVR